MTTNEKATNPKDAIGATKVSISKIPSAGQIETSLALSYGAVMYDPYNWREEGKKVGYMTYIDALLRHIYRFIDGEDLDPDSLVHHLGHIPAGAQVLFDAIKSGNAIDDRPPKGTASQYMDEVAKRLPELQKHWALVKEQKMKEKAKNECPTKKKHGFHIQVGTVHCCDESEKISVEGDPDYGSDA